MFPLVRGHYLTRHGRAAEVRDIEIRAAIGVAEKADGTNRQIRWDKDTGIAYGSGTLGEWDIVAHGTKTDTFRCVWRAGGKLDGERCDLQAPSSGIRDCCCDHHRAGFYIRMTPDQRRIIWEIAIKERSVETSICSPAATRRKARIERRIEDSSRRVVIRQNAIKTLHNRCRIGAEARGIRFDLTTEDLISMAEACAYRCSVSGIPFSAERVGNSPRLPYGPSIDRIDSTGPYSKDNCRLVCYAVNLAMGEWGEEVVETISKAFNSRLITSSILQVQPS